MKEEAESLVGSQHTAGEQQPEVGRSRWRRLVFALIFAVVGLLLAVLVTGAIVQERSQRFLDNGKSIVKGLEQFSRAVQSKD